MLHVVSGPSSLFHSVNLIPVSMAVNLLFLCLSYCLPLLILHYHHAQLPHCFTASLKPICFINLSYLKTDSTDCHMDQFLRAKLVFVFILFFPCLLFLVQCCRLSRLSVSFLTHHKHFVYYCTFWFHSSQAQFHSKSICFGQSIMAHPVPVIHLWYFINVFWIDCTVMLVDY